MSLLARLGNAVLVGSALIIINFFPFQAQANPSELSVSGGLLYEDFSGPVNGSKLVPTTLEANYSLFLSDTKALVFRYTLAMSLPDSLGYYYGTAVGERYFFSSKGYRTQADENGVHLEVMPDWRYFWGYDFGISQVIVKSFGPVLQATSTNLTAAAYIGVSKQIANDWSVQGLLGLGTGYGFSSIAIVELTPRLLFGIGHSF